MILLREPYFRVLEFSGRYDFKAVFCIKTSLEFRIINLKF